jgi:hypothetical protein
MQNSTDKKTDRKETRFTRILDGAFASLLAQIAFVCVVWASGFVSHALVQSPLPVLSTEAPKPLTPPETTNQSASASTYVVPVFAILACLYLLVLLHYRTLLHFLFWHTREIRAFFSFVLIAAIILFLVYLFCIAFPEGIEIRM